MSARRLSFAVAALAVVGAAIAGYLTWVHYAGIEAYCVGGTSGCERVQSSPYAELAGVPVAVIGLAGYLAVLGSLALPDRSLTVFLALAGAGFSGYLTYLELAVIDAICQWCVASAVVMIALAAIAVSRYLA
ncbi:MAG TPA: vitamin K epoxide reductase family protein, partial [Solirubrobacteraceae bacterium]|nr:vitamin K epoxide reductase family protein [Solirubrobacteraceae bacterium]